MNLSLIRNFSIIAHIDHGKSTLADRMLEITQTVAAREMVDQYLDSMDIERERGITIKAQTARMVYRAKDGREYVLNLIDTPGHVDFSYEVSRSLAACEGVLLVVDAAQGIQAQTLANAYLALDANVAILPVLNKIDLPTADPERVARQMMDLLGSKEGEILRVSAKAGWGVPELMEAIIQRIGPPQSDGQAPLKALVFDSWFDPYRGAVVLVRLFDGEIRPGMNIEMMVTGQRYEVDEVGVLTPALRPAEALSAGEVGYVMAGIKEIGDVKVGDTVTEARRPTASPFPGYKEPKPMVFCGLYPVEGTDFESLKAALEKLHLNDTAFTYEPETSAALGFGYRCGFLGLLHMDVIRERLEREYDLTLLTTSPTVAFRVTTTDGQTTFVNNPIGLPPVGRIAKIEEPYVLGSIVVPSEYLGAIMRLCQEKRGIQRRLEYLDAQLALLEYELPLSEILFDFYDRLKSVSRGYASFDYAPCDFRPSDLVKLDILLNAEAVDALSLILHKEKAYFHGRALVEKMRDIIPRQLFEVVIQAAIGSRVIARETVKPLRKHVTAKCYGGDVTRKRKLLEKQKEGKKRMKRVGRVEVPQEAFMAVLNVSQGASS
ncbi:MAG: elongation factor 4 [Candidatus Tectomicrobia bacterium]|nr:elongation factor 4 [Candidatus Tectomicrobia bacterium]